jgi:uncharacterized protein with PIN domain
MRKQAKLNSTVVYREKGEQGLRKDLVALELDELKTIIRTYCPDCNGTIYRKKDKDKQIVIDYIIERSKKLSCIGQCFRSDLVEKK